MALMLNDSPHSDTKVARLTRTISYDGKKAAEIQVTAVLLIFEFLTLNLFLWVVNLITFF